MMHHICTYVYTRERKKKTAGQFVSNRNVTKHFKHPMIHAKNLANKMRMWICYIFLLYHIHTQPYIVSSKRHFFFFFVASKYRPIKNLLLYKICNINSWVVPSIFCWMDWEWVEIVWSYGFMAAKRSFSNDDKIKTHISQCAQWLTPSPAPRKYVCVCVCVLLVSCTNFHIAIKYIVDKLKHNSSVNGAFYA